MDKDDYQVLKYKILLYLYGVFKCKYIFDLDTFSHYIKHDLDDYVENILRMMQSDDLITGLVFKKAFGNEYILVSDLYDLEITSKGLDLVCDKEKNQKLIDYFIKTGDIILKILSITGLG